MNEENVTLDSKKMAELALDYKELRNMTLINDGEVLYIKNSKGEAVNIHDYTKYDYLMDLNVMNTEETKHGYKIKCKNICRSERTCNECLKDKIYLPELQNGDILVAEEDYTLFIYYHDNYVLDTSENVFKTLDDVKNERIICQVRRLKSLSDNLKEDTEIWTKR